MFKKNGKTFYCLSTFRALNAKVEELPETNSIYYWHFSPFRAHFSNGLKEISDYKNFDDIFLELKKIEKFRLDPWIMSNHIFKVTVDTPDLEKDEKTFLGLSHQKIDALRDYLDESETNRKFFIRFIDEILFNVPFYIGKADNLKIRIKQHIKGQTQILDFLKDLNKNFGIGEECIYVGYQEINTGVVEDPDLITAFEAIAQRILRGQLVKRIG
jgi:hypothetical protein